MLLLPCSAFYSLRFFVGSDIAPEVVAGLSRRQLEIAVEVIHMFNFLMNRDGVVPKGSKGSWMELYMKQHDVGNALVVSEWNNSVWAKYEKDTGRRRLNYQEIYEIQNASYAHVFPGAKLPTEEDDPVEQCEDA